MDVVQQHQHRRSSFHHQRGEEGDAVLAVDHTSDVLAVDEHPQQHPGVDRAPTATPDDPVAVDLLLARLTGDRGREQDDVMAALGEAAGQSLAHKFGTAGLGMFAVPPVGDRPPGLAGVVRGALISTRSASPVCDERATCLSQLTEGLHPIDERPEGRSGLSLHWMGSSIIRCFRRRARASTSTSNANPFSVLAAKSYFATLDVEQLEPALGVGDRPAQPRGHGAECEAAQAADPPLWNLVTGTGAAPGSDDHLPSGPEEVEPRDGARREGWRGRRRSSRRRVPSTGGCPPGPRLPCPGYDS